MAMDCAGCAMNNVPSPEIRSKILAQIIGISLYMLHIRMYAFKVKKLKPCFVCDIAVTVACNCILLVSII